MQKEKAREEERKGSEMEVVLLRGGVKCVSPSVSRQKKYEKIDRKGFLHRAICILGMMVVVGVVKPPPPLPPPPLPPPPPTILLLHYPSLVFLFLIF